MKDVLILKCYKQQMRNCLHVVKVLKIQDIEEIKEEKD